MYCSPYNDATRTETNYCKVELHRVPNCMKQQIPLKESTENKVSFSASFIGELCT